MSANPNRFDAAAEAGDALEIISVDDRRGRGVRALRPFLPGDILDHFDGDVGDQICQHSLQIGAGQHISGTRYIGYLSHGCDPNALLDMKHFTLVARKPIAVGQTVTIDYAETEDRLHRQFPCACGAASCRGWITGRDEKPSAEGLAWLASIGAARPDAG